MKQDWREFLTDFEKSHPHDVLHIEEELNPKFEPTALIMELDRQQRYPVVYFHKIAGSGFPVIANTIATRERLGLGIGVTERELPTAFVRTPNIEVNEVQYPHITLCHEMEPDTAGPGEFRGGAGIRYQIKFYSDADIVMFGDGKKIPPYGLENGGTGSTNRPMLEYQDGRQEQLNTKELPRKVQAGDTLTLISSGGGGWGNPKDRDPEKVREDYRNGLISRETARDVYGVDLA